MNPQQQFANLLGGSATPNISFDAATLIQMMNAAQGSNVIGGYQQPQMIPPPYQQPPLQQLPQLDPNISALLSQLGQNPKVLNVLKDRQ